MRSARTSPVTKPILLLVWHEAGNPAYWDRFRALAEFFEVKVLGLRRFRGREFVAPRESEPFSLTLCSAVFDRHWLSFLSFGLCRDIWRTGADILYVHEEPHAATSFLAAVLKKGRRLILDCAVINTRGSFGRANPFERFVYRRADGVFSRNREVEVVLVARGCDPRKILGTIGNGVSRRTFHGAGRETARRQLVAAFPVTGPMLRGDRMLVAFAGQIWRPKGLSIFVDLVKNYSCNVMVCGDTVDAGLADELRRGGILVLPRLQLDRLRDFYSAADLFVLPSEPTEGWREQFGRVLPESIFCGTPAVGSRLGAIPSILGEDATFVPCDLLGLIAVLKRLQSPEARASLLRRQTANVEAEFTWEAIARKVHAQVVTQPGAPGP